MSRIALFVGFVAVAGLGPHAAPCASADSAIWAGGPAPASATVETSLEASPCVAHTDKLAAPAHVGLGDEVGVTLDLRVDCPGEPVPLDAVLVLDRSSSMLGQPMNDARAAATTFVDLVDLGRARVGVVSFARTARTDLRLIDDRERLRGAIARIEAEGSTSISDGLREAGRVLTSASPRPGATRSVVLLTDGLDMLGPDAVSNQAAQIRGQGVHLVTIALGLRADADLLRSIASTPADAYVAPDSADLNDIYTRLADRLAGVEARDIVVRDELPGDMELVPGSLVPTASVDGRTVTWRLPLLPPDGVRLTYKVRPSMVGYRPTNAAADASYIDSAGRTGQATFPVPYVTVSIDPPTLTHTPSGPPSVTATPEISETPTEGTAVAVTPTPDGTTQPPGGSPTPDGTPTRLGTSLPTAPPGPTWPGPRRTSTPALPHDAFLPVVGSICRLSVVPADVVLVIDTSTTMLEPTAAGRRKLDAAVEAVGLFADRLDLTEHRVALVGFDSMARTLAALTADRDTFRDALRSVEARQGSRIDLGLSQAAAILDASSRGGARGVVVLLSDGRPSGATPDEVRSEARRLRERGALVYAVSLGTTADHELMHDIAAVPGRFVDAGDGERLDTVYASIAGKLRCR